MLFHYYASDSALDSVYIETGHRPHRRQRLMIDDQAMTSEQRKLIVTWTGILAESNLTYYPVNLGKPQVSSNPVLRTPPVVIITEQFDKILEPSDVWPILQSMIVGFDDTRKELATAKAAYTEAVAERKADRERIEIQRKADRARREAERKAKREQAINDANNIGWDENGKAVIDLLPTLFLLSGDQQDQRFNSWAKTVTAVTEKHDNGYDFAGEFVDEGTIEIKRQRTVYLVASCSGSRKYRTIVYRVLILNPDTGKIEHTDVWTTNASPGWALRIRDGLKALL